MKIKNDNYFLISGFMVNRLGLKGNALLVYAIIYGFSQDGETWFNGSRQYLCDFTGASKSTIDRTLLELEASGLITKYTETRNGVSFNIYKANEVGVVKMTNDTLVKMNRGVVKMNTNNIDNNIDINNIDKENIIIDNNIKEIYDYWNSCDIIKHNNLTQDMINVLKKLLNEFDVEQLQECIEHYSEAYHSEYQYCKYKWNLLTFFKQKNAWLEFLDDGSKWNNYLRWKQENKPVSRTNNMELDLDSKPDTINGNTPNLEIRAERYFENLYHNNIDKYYTELEKLKAKDIKLAQYVIKQVENGGFDEL